MAESIKKEAMRSIALALGAGHSYSDLLSYFYSKSSYISDLVKEIMDNGDIESVEDLEYLTEVSKYLGKGFNLVVKKQEFEKAARFKDLRKERGYIASLVGSISEKDEDAIGNVDYWTDLYRAELDSSDPFEIIVDPGSAKPEEIAELLNEISKLYKMIGGSGLTFSPTDIQIGVACE